MVAFRYCPDFTTQSLSSAPLGALDRSTVCYGRSNTPIGQHEGIGYTGETISVSRIALSKLPSEPFLEAWGEL